MAREKVLAWIVPVDVEVPPETPPLPEEPPSIWPSPGRPVHPIFWPPTVQHPIVIIPPDWLAPGVPPDPIVWPTPPGTVPPPTVQHPIVPSAEHPIYFPKPPERPPIVGDPHPEHPIYFPVPPPPGDAHVEHPIYFPNPKGVVIAFPNYAGTPPPPDGVPKNHVPAVVWFGPGTLAMVVWIPPMPPTPKK